MDFKQIQDLVKLASKAELTELKIEEGDFKITIRTKNYSSGSGVVQVSSPAAIPAAPTLQPANETPKAASNDASDSKSELSSEDNPNYVTIKSPMIGTFYRSPGPDKDVFVKVGDNVDKGSVTCIIEAMKLFNEIESEIQGKIVKVLAEDASPVEYDQPLFIIDPS